MNTFLNSDNQRQSIIGILNMAEKCRTSICFHAPVTGKALRIAYRGWLQLAKSKRLLYAK